MLLKPRIIVLCYVVFGFAWIFFSDRLVLTTFQDAPAAIGYLSMLKGFIFVSITALLLAVLLSRHGAAFRRKEQELQESQARYRLVVESAPDAIFVLDGTTCVYANAAAVRLLGAGSAAQLVDSPFPGFLVADSRPTIQERLARAVTDACPTWLADLQVRRVDGRAVEVEGACVPFPLEHREGALVFLRDIEERQAAARSLRESEAKYRLLADNAHDCIFTLDTAMRPTYVSPSVERLRGVPAERAMRESLQDILTPASCATVQAAVAKHSRNGVMDVSSVERMELELVRSDGSTVWVENVVRPMLDGAGQFVGYVGVCRDCTERRLAEEERNRSERFLSRILSAIPDPVFVKDAAHRFVLANEALCAMLGQPRENVLGHLDEDFVRQDEARAFLAGDDLVLANGGEHVAEERLTDTQGRLRTILTKKGLFVDTKGARFIVGVIRDVTADKRRETQLRDSLREKEVLLKEVHHRVKNNLQIISSLLFLQKEGIEDPAIQDLFEESRNRIASMALVHEELYRSGDLGRVDIKEYLERLVPKVVASLHGNKRVGLSLELCSCPMPLDKVIPFGLVVNELLTNAVKHGFARRDEGHIRVAVDLEDAVIRLVVEDDGNGLPANFHPEAVKSLGMQLIVQLTRQLCGALTFGSGQGSVFRVAFPLDNAPKA